MRSPSFVALGVAIFVAGSVQAKTGDYPISFGAWNGNAYTSDASGLFTHCAVQAPYDGGILMLIAVSRTFEWSLGFVNPQWSLQIGAQYPISYRIDTSDWKSAVAVARAGRFAAVTMDNSTSLVELFRHGQVMHVLIGAQVFSFSLDGTAQALPELVTCVNHALASEHPDATGYQPQPPQTILQGDAQGTAPNQYREEAQRVLSNFLLQARFPNARLLPPTEAPGLFEPSSARWRSNTLSGALFIVDDSAHRTAADIASAQISSDSRACKGSFASGSTPITVYHDSVLETLTACATDTATTEVRYDIISRPSGGLYVFEFISSTTKGIKSTTSQPSPFDDGTLRGTAYQVTH